MMSKRNGNHPFIIWGTCYLWLASLVSIIWSMTLFFKISDYLVLTQTDLVVAVTLLSGIMMIPSNVLLLNILSNEKKVESKIKIWCCPLWTSMLWVVIVDTIGGILCIHRITNCGTNTQSAMSSAMTQYRNSVRLKGFIDNVQWYFKCCGLRSYKDWLKQDWYDKIREYEWDANSVSSITEKSDSVPSSCCKSGSCVPNYLTELGPYSINTAGCASSMFFTVMTCLWAHFLVFFSVVGVEVLIIKLINLENIASSSNETRELMSPNRKFATSSSSRHLGSRETDKILLSTK